jgi:protein-tyrosine phosphatase
LATHRRRPVAFDRSIEHAGDLGRREFGMKILYVCLGNICRSPTAEGVSRHLAARRAPELGLLFDSAGTADYHVGQPPDGRSQRAAKKRGVDIGELRGRQVCTADFSQFDWILAMDRDNLAELRAIRPAKSTARLELFLSAQPCLGSSDVPDPYYGDETGFDAVFDLIERVAGAWLDCWGSGQ